MYFTFAWYPSLKIIKTQLTAIPWFLKHCAEVAVTLFMGDMVSSVTHDQERKEQNIPQQLAVALNISNLFEPQILLYQNSSNFIQ